MRRTLVLQGSVGYGEVLQGEKNQRARVKLTEVSSSFTAAWRP